MRLKATYILTAKHIKSLKDEKEIIREVEKAFVAYAQDKAQMPSKVYLDLKEHNGDFRAMPAYLPHTKSASLKWVNVHPNNKALPTVMGTIILSDPKTGFPQSIMDGTLITKWRTAAASAVATKYLAPKKSSVLSIIGCGAQALSQVHFINCVMNVKKVCLWDIDIKQAKILCAQLRKSFDEVIVCETARTCVTDADVIVTLTPSRKPLIKKQWLKEGVHINAIGADAPGKQELDNNILESAGIIIDDWDQASHSGEINVAVHQKKVRRRNIRAMIGEVILKKSKGRRAQNEITVFDSTGLAIQDTAVASLMYRLAIKEKIGKRINLID